MIVLALLLLLSVQPLLSQQLFASRCAACHGEDARGTAKGPGLAMNPRVAEQSVEQLRAYLERGNPGAGMPSFADLPADDLDTLARYLRRINVDTILGPVTAPGAHPQNHLGRAATRRLAHLQRQRLGQSLQSAQTDQHRECVLAEVEMGLPHFVLRPGDDAARSGRRALRHGSEPGLRARRAHRQCALALFASAPAPGMVGDARLGTNRGVAILRDKVFFVTDNAHLLALDRATGKLLWETAMAPDRRASALRRHHGAAHRQRYGHRRCRRRR